MNSTFLNEIQQGPKPSASAAIAADQLTILRHPHNLLAKTWRADGTIKQYDEAKFFTRQAVEVGNLTELSAVLEQLQGDPHRCVIRGKYVGDELAKFRDPEHQAGKVRRALDYFDDQPLHTVLLDVENFKPMLSDPMDDPEESIAEFIHLVLPEPFRSAGYHWQLSNSAGHPTKRDGELRVHLWFWLSEPRTSAELKAWAKATGVAVDKAVFNPVQVHYTAAPLMEPGVVDTIAVRCGLVDGPPVVLVIDEALLAQAKAGETTSRGQHLRDVASSDPVVAKLDVRSACRDGYNIVCPFVDEHGSGAGGETSTQYYLPNTGGRIQSNFKCLHDACVGRTRGMFLSKLGIDEVLDEFTVIEPVAGATESAGSAAAVIRNAQRASLHQPLQVIDNVTGELVEVMSPAFSDDQLALEFAALAHRAVRYTPGMGWMSAGEHHWQRDENLHRMSVARSMCREVAALAEKPHERKALASARTVNAVVTLAQSDPRLLVPAAQWDADRFALNTPAGVVDLRTGAVRPRAVDLVTRTTRVSPDLDAACPTWLRFINGVCADDAQLVGFLHKVLGYLLTGDRREQKLFFIWGRGSNGKSTLGELLLWIMGGYGMKLSSSVLMQSAHDRHPTELAQLHGVRAAVSSELEEGAFFNEARVKELTGDDTLSARFMRGDFFEFAMQHKHLVIGNHKPRLRGGDPAMARRLVLIPFTAAFGGDQVDAHMPEKLRAEAPAILAWMVRGSVRWHAEGLELPAAVRTASDEYMLDHNDVEQWAAENCLRGPDARERAGVLYESFSRWKLRRGERAPSQVTWAERMTLMPGITKARSGGIQYRGIGLDPRSNAEDFA